MPLKSRYYLLSADGNIREYVMLVRLKLKTLGQPIDTLCSKKTSLLCIGNIRRMKYREFTNGVRVLSVTGPKISFDGGDPAQPA